MQFEGKVIVLVPHLAMAVLEDHIVIGELISGAFINLGAAILITVIFPVLFIVFKPGFDQAVAVFFNLTADFIFSVFI